MFSRDSNDLEWKMRRPCRYNKGLKDASIKNLKQEPLSLVIRHWPASLVEN